MNLAEFDNIVKNTVADIQGLLALKGTEYSGVEDRLANFKRGAELTGTTALQVCFIYMSKHYDAIATYVRKHAAGELGAMSEPIEGRLHDLMNYCLLMKGLIAEEAAKELITQGRAPDFVIPGRLVTPIQSDMAPTPV